VLLGGGIDGVLDDPLDDIGSAVKDVALEAVERRAFTAIAPDRHRGSDDADGTPELVLANDAQQRPHVGSGECFTHGGLILHWGVVDKLELFNSPAFNFSAFNSSAFRGVMGWKVMIFEFLVFEFWYMRRT